MKQLRENFEPIRKQIEAGEEFLLLYRSKPLARITPYQTDPDFSPSPKKIFQPKQEDKPIEITKVKEEVENIIEAPKENTAIKKPEEKIEQQQQETQRIVNKFGMRKMFEP